MEFSIEDLIRLRLPFFDVLVKTFISSGLLLLFSNHCYLIKEDTFSADYINSIRRGLH